MVSASLGTDDSQRATSPPSIKKSPQPQGTKRRTPTILGRSHDNLMPSLRARQQKMKELKEKENQVPSRRPSMTIGSGASPRALPVKQQAAKTLDDVETALRAVQAALKATRAPPSTKRAAQTAVQAVMARGRQAQRQCPQDPWNAQDNA